MKDYRSIADSVLQRRDEYIEKRKKKRAAFIRRTSIALSCCLVILAGFGIWRMDLLERIMPSQSGSDYIVTEYTANITEETGSRTTSAMPTTSSGPETAVSGSETAAVTTAATSGSAGSSTSSAVTASRTTQSAASASTTATVKTTGSDEVQVATEESPRRTTTVSATTTTRTATTSHTSYTSTVTTTYTNRTTTSRYSSTTTTSQYTRTTSQYSSTTTTSQYTRTTPQYSETTTTPQYTHTTTTSFLPNTTSSSDGGNGNGGSGSITTTTMETGSVGVTTTTALGSIHIPQGFYGNGGSVYFELTGANADISLTEGPLESGIVYPDDAPPIDYQSYSLRNIKAEFMRAVKFSGDDRYLIGINNDWIPDDLSSLVSGMDMAEYMELGLAYDCVSGAYIGIPDKDTILGFLADNGSRSTVIGVSDNFLMNEYLSGNLSDPPEDDTDDLLMRVEISMPQLISGDKYYSSGYMKITRDGRLVFDMLKLKYTYNIGTEAAKAFAASLSP